MITPLGTCALKREMHIAVSWFWFTLLMKCDAKIFTLFVLFFPHYNHQHQCISIEFYVTDQHKAVHNYETERK